MKERSNTPLLVIGMAAIVIPLCCYLMVLSSLPDVWMKGGCEMADEAIKKNEKESHDAREKAKQAEEAVERAMIIDTSI